MKAVPLSRNRYTTHTHFLVDADLYDQIVQFKWFLDRGGNGKGHFRVVRASTEEERAYGAPQKIKLHRFIMNLHLRRDRNMCMIVDHINGDTLDNRKENLRIITQAENCKSKPAVVHTSLIE